MNRACKSLDPLPCSQFNYPVVGIWLRTSIQSFYPPNQEVILSVFSCYGNCEIWKLILSLAIWILTNTFIYLGSIYSKGLQSQWSQTSFNDVQNSSFLLKNNSNNNNVNNNNRYFTTWNLKGSYENRYFPEELHIQHLTSVIVLTLIIFLLSSHQLRFLIQSSG